MNREQRREWRRDLKRRRKATHMLAREPWQIRTIATLDRVFEERVRQVAQYGHNDDFDNGTGPDAMWLTPYTYSGAGAIQETLRNEYEEYENRLGAPTWMHLVREEITEAFQEDEPERLAEELLQVAALCVSWVETLEGRRREQIDS